MQLGYLQFEKRVRNLQHKDMGMAMVMHHQDTLARPSHAPVLIIVLEPLKPSRDRRVLFWLVLFCPVHTLRVMRERNRYRG